MNENGYCGNCNRINDHAAAIAFESVVRSHIAKYENAENCFNVNILELEKLYNKAKGILGCTHYLIIQLLAVITKQCASQAHHINQCYLTLSSSIPLSNIKSHLSDMTRHDLNSTDMTKKCIKNQLLLLKCIECLAHKCSGNCQYAPYKMTAATMCSFSHSVEMSATQYALWLYKDMIQIGNTANALIIGGRYINAFQSEYGVDDEDVIEIKKLLTV